MISRPARTLTGAVLAATLTAAVLSGCSDVRKLMNQGGDTPCSDYVKQDLDTKRVTITKFVKQKQDDDAHEPAGTIVDATMAAV
ncbi:MAG: hypothetical protein J2P18_22725, partial [Nocardia sp.]|nr:hypothetical protein [Nocardia sp.]